jgi:hypothetical protein
MVAAEPHLTHRRGSRHLRISSIDLKDGDQIEDG